MTTEPIGNRPEELLEWILASVEPPEVQVRVLEALFQRVDDDVRERVHLIDARSGRRRTEERFSSQELVDSVVRCGVTLTFALRILVEVHGRVVAARKSDLSSHELREYVRTAIQTLRGGEASPQQRQHWSNLYARKFGRDEAQRHLMSARGAVKLTYSLLKDTVIPNTLASATSCSPSRFKRVASSRELSRMGNEIMSPVEDLGKYRIHDETIRRLILEAACQPPHPWLAVKHRGFDCLEYHLDRSRHPLGSLGEALAGEPSMKGQVAAREALHHLAGAFLAYYGEWLGVGDMRPLENLYRAVRAVSKREPFVALPSGQLATKLADDLRAAGSDVRSIRVILESLIRHLARAHVQTDLQGLARRIQTMGEIVVSVTSTGDRAALPEGGLRRQADHGAT